LNTKSVAIFLNFPTDICAPCFNKQSNRYG
jgi:hypothetical protein